MSAQSSFYPVVLPPPKPCPLCSPVDSRGHITEHGNSVITLHLFQPSSPWVDQVFPCPEGAGRSRRGTHVSRPSLLFSRLVFGETRKEHKLLDLEKTFRG